jgi:hypothetical protein
MIHVQAWAPAARRQCWPLICESQDLTCRTVSDRVAHGVAAYQRLLSDLVAQSLGRPGGQALSRAAVRRWRRLDGTDEPQAILERAGIQLALTVSVE